MLISHMTCQQPAMFLCRQCSHPQHLPTAVQWSSRGKGMAWVALAEVADRLETYLEQTWNGSKAA